MRGNLKLMSSRESLRKGSSLPASSERYCGLREFELRIVLQPLLWPLFFVTLDQFINVSEAQLMPLSEGDEKAHP